MSLGYNDLNDLIQNQRALAELVYEIKDHYDELQKDIEYAKDVDARIQQLNTELTTTMNKFNGQMSDLDSRMQAQMTQLQKQSENLQEELTKWMNVFQVDANGQPALVKKLVDDIVWIQDWILNGVTQDDGTRTPGLAEMYQRLRVLETKSPPLVIYPDGEENDIPIADRLQGVLYGRITNQVTDIESGQVIKISPYMQGVIVDDY